MIGIALAGGGERVVAWEVGVLAGLADAGLTGAGRILGTSAGALVAARLAARIDPREDAAAIARRGAARRVPAGAEAFARFGAAPAGSAGAEAFARLGAAWQTAGPTLRERRRALGSFALAHSPGAEDEAVARLAPRVPAAWPAALRIAAVDADSGERVVLSGGDVARAVAASRAVPGLRPPVSIGGRRLIDGALGSATNADLLTAAVVIVIVPLDLDEPSTLVEQLWAEALRAELETLQQAGREVLVIDARPDDLAAMGPDPMSGANAALAVAAGRARAAQISPLRAA